MTEKFPQLKVWQSRKSVYTLWTKLSLKQRKQSMHTHTHPKKSSYQLFGNFFYKDDKILLSRNFAKNALERIPAHSVEKREIHCHANCFRQINLK